MNRGDFMPERPDLRPERPDFRDETPERSVRRGGQTDGRTNTSPPVF